MAEEKTPKCKCGGVDTKMKEIGEIGKTEQVMEVQNGVLVMAGVREQMLYQCPECKNIEIY